MNSVKEIIDAIATHLESEVYVDKEIRESDYAVIKCTDDDGNEYVIKVIQMNAVDREDLENDFDDCLSEDGSIFD